MQLSMQARERNRLSFKLTRFAIVILDLRRKCRFCRVGPYAKMRGSFDNDHFS